MTRRHEASGWPRPAWALLITGLGWLPPAGAIAAVASPPATQIDDVSDRYFDGRVADPYRWLEAGGTERVDGWSSAQNERTRSYLDGLAYRAPLGHELKRLTSDAPPYYKGLAARGDRVFAVYSDPAQQQPVIVALGPTLELTTRQTVLDPNVLDTNGTTAFDWYVPSPDGTKIAVSLSQNGSEDGTLHVYDVASGREIETPIPRVQYATAGGSLAWCADSRCFWYTRYPGDEVPADERHFNMQVYLHHLGESVDRDRLALGTRDGLERISEVVLRDTPGRSEVLAAVARGDGGEFAYYLLAPERRPVRLASYEDGVVSATLAADGAIYAVSRDHALAGKVLKLTGLYTNGALARAGVLIAPGRRAIVTGAGLFDNSRSGDLVLAGDQLFVPYIEGGPASVGVFHHTGHPHGFLPLPPVATNSELLALPSGELVYDIETYLKPQAFFRFDSRTGAVRPTALERRSLVNFADTEVVRASAVSKDGTRIPLSIIRRRGTALDGKNPTLLYGYGGYGISEVPTFLGAMLRLWLDAGGVYVVAHIRGGAEYGERWHREGMLTRKQNVFDDFAAAAQRLVQLRYTSPEHLALMGGSNGGLLMGAIITQHPELARAVVSMSGVYDMLRTELDPNGAFNVTEYGTVQKRAEFEALYAYSPYHHVRAGMAYPAVLMTTGATDARVDPMQSRKFTAALQAASSGGRPVFLRTSATTGHGFGSALDETIALQADTLAFLFDQLGMHYPPDRRAGAAAPR